jgi:predicted kinase
MLILMAGLPGTGKTTVAHQLADRLRAVVLNKDEVRHAIFPPELVEYSTKQDDFVSDILLRSAEYLWNINPQRMIILDGRTFSRASQRQHVVDFAEKRNQRWLIIECVCDDDVARQRLLQPDPSHPAGNRTPELYEEVKRRWEPITEPKRQVRTDATIDLDAIVQAVFEIAPHDLS